MGTFFDVKVNNFQFLNCPRILWCTNYCKLCCVCVCVCVSVCMCVSSSTAGCLPLKVIFQKRLFSNKRSSSIEGHLPLKVVFHQRSSSTEDCLPPTITLWLILYLWEQSTNLSLLPAMHDAWFMIHDAWFMMHDSWCMMNDAWWIMHDVTP